MMFSLKFIKYHKEETDVSGASMFPNGNLGTRAHPEISG